MLGCLSMGLLMHLRNQQTYHLCQLMKSLDTAPEYVALIHQLVRGAHTLLLRAKNIQTGCRLALINNDMTKALIFEPDNKSLTDLERAGGSTSGKQGGAASRSTDPQIHVTEIVLENTLLLDAVQKGKARFVSDCASFIQVEAACSGMVGAGQLIRERAYALCVWVCTCAVRLQILDECQLVQASLGWRTAAPLSRVVLGFAGAEVLACLAKILAS